MKHLAATSRYSAGAILLHWLIAATLLFEIGLGWRMDEPGPQRFAVYQLHKSVGITILVLTLLRVGWRLMHRPPPLSSELAPWERALAHMTHLGFYALLLGLPLTGWLLVSTSPLSIPTVLYGVVPLPHLPVGSGVKAGFHGFAEIGHEGLGYALYALFALHIAGALKHHFVDRGDDLGRMLPVGGNRLTAGLAFVALLTAGLVFAGNRFQLVDPTPPAPAVLAPAQPLDPAPAPEAPAAADVASPAEPADALENAVESAPEKEEEAAQPAQWKVAGDKSTLGFRTSWGGSALEGKFGRWTADILFDPDALDRSSVKVEIDMGSVTASYPEAQSALPGDDWFAASRYPTATFIAKRFRKLGGDRYEAAGELRLRGVSRPLTLPFTLKINGKRAQMSGTAQVDRIRFGVGQGQWSSTAEIPADVAVRIELEAVRE